MKICFRLLLSISWWDICTHFSWQALLLSNSLYWKGYVYPDVYFNIEVLELDIQFWGFLHGDWCRLPDTFYIIAQLLNGCVVWISVWAIRRSIPLGWRYLDKGVFKKILINEGSHSSSMLQKSIFNEEAFLHISGQNSSDSSLSTRARIMSAYLKSIILVKLPNTYDRKAFFAHYHVSPISWSPKLFSFTKCCQMFILLYDLSESSKLIEQSKQRYSNNGDSWIFDSQIKYMSIVQDFDLT